MKTVMKINPEHEYETAKGALHVLSTASLHPAEVKSIDSALDNLNTVVNVLIERLSPKKRPKLSPKKDRRRRPRKPREECDRLPSQKFPDLDVEEIEHRHEHAPNCSCCNQQMSESGLFKVSEKLEIIPKSYSITRHKRVIYRCSHCNGSMQNAPAVPSICPASGYGDSVIIDASLSKYCDLIPMERYCAIAAREGLPGIPPNSMIGLTHILAEFLKLVYARIKQEVVGSRIIFADETPHKMLEGDERLNWYLWIFSTSTSCYFAAHDTRSGDVPYKFLEASAAEVLLTDGYSAYKSCLKKLKEQSGRIIEEAHCNAHALRYFKEAAVNWEKECEDILPLYGEIYDLEAECRTVSRDDKTQIRAKMGHQFERLKKLCEGKQSQAVAKSSFEKALNYFLNHHDGLTRCCLDIDIPIDNNSSERTLRSPVVGRKTWYGTHSKRGAKTSAVLFSIVESCKLNAVNPRRYFHWITEQILAKKPPLSPKEYAIYDSG